MKNLIIKSAFLLLTCTIYSFQSATQPTLQEIFQTALNIETLEEHLAKNSAGETLPLTLVSNDYIPTHLNLDFAGHKVFIQSNLENVSAKAVSILELTEIKRKGKKTHLAFKYGEKTIKIRLKKEDNIWIAKTISLKWKNGFETKLVTSEEKHF